MNSIRVVFDLTHLLKGLIELRPEVNLEKITQHSDGNDTIFGCTTLSSFNFGNDHNLINSGLYYLPFLQRNWCGSWSVDGPGQPRLRHFQDEFNTNGSKKLMWFSAVYTNISLLACARVWSRISQIYIMCYYHLGYYQKKKRIYRAQFDKKHRPISGPTPTYITNVWLKPRLTLTWVNRVGSGQAFC